MSAGVLIVGLGQIGMGYDLKLDPARHVYSHARAFSQHPRFRLLAAVDPDAQRRATFATIYAAPAYADLTEALSAHRPDLVVIAAPTHLHAATLLQVLEAGAAKVVLCEKPLSYDLEEARSMVREATARGVHLYVNYMRRSDAGVLECKRRFDSGQIGAPEKGVVWYSKGFLHNGSHFFNLLEYWLGAMRDFSIVNRGRVWQGVDPEPDVQVVFEKGSVVFLAAWEESFSHYSVELLSRQGRLRYERGGKLIEWQSALPDPQLPGYVKLSESAESIASGMDRYQWHVAEQLARSIDGGSAELCDASDALRTLTNMNSILERL
jgi:predicted dehydrogenase